VVGQPSSTLHRERTTQATDLRQSSLNSSHCPRFSFAYIRNCPEAEPNRSLLLLMLAVASKACYLQGCRHGSFTFPPLLASWKGLRQTEKAGGRHCHPFYVDTLSYFFWKSKTIGCQTGLEGSLRPPCLSNALLQAYYQSTEDTLRSWSLT
jgi:hypothetical protein